MPNKQTLTSYIRTMTTDNLYKLHDYIIGEMNRRKATEQNVDVGFWNSDGVYIPDIQKIDEQEEWQVLGHVEDDDFYGDFTPRELEIMKYLCLDPREIAKRLFISLSTVRTHIGSIREKVGTNKRICLVRLLRKGVIKLEDLVIE